jgi:3-dehydroquinate synthase
VSRPGALDDLGELCREEVGAHRYAVVADAEVARLYGDRVVAALEEAGCPARLFTFPPGEASKSREAWSRLTDELLAAGYGRDAAVVALGGGVTGDLAGFVAATYLRGVPVVQAPTTVMAMLDSSVGGKTAVDTGAGKNLVGAFHHPSLVVADPGVLETLPPRQVAAGLSEGVKAAAIADADLMTWIEEEAEALAAGAAGVLSRLVRRGVEIKAEVVAEDPEEAGRRKVLNFGHTVGHALEALSGWHLLHGEAVAEGMRVEARLGEAMGVTEPGTARRLAGVLRRCGHAPGAGPGPEAARVLEAMATDKKARQGRVEVVLLERIGRVARAGDGSYARPLPSEDAEELVARALQGGRG